MNRYAEPLKSYLKDNPLQFSEGTTLLEQLYWCYAECNPIDNEALKAQFSAVYKSMPKLSDEKFDRVFMEISKLQVTAERLAFQAGIKIGLRLALELSE